MLQIVIMRLTLSILVLLMVSGTTFAFTLLDNKDQINSTTETNQIDSTSKEKQTASNPTPNKTVSNSKGNEIASDSRGNQMAYNSKLRQISYYNSKRNHTRSEHQLTKTRSTLSQIVDKILTMLNGFHLQLSSDFLTNGGVRVGGKVAQSLFTSKDKTMNIVAHADYNGVVLAPNSTKGLSNVGVTIYD